MERALMDTVRLWKVCGRRKRIFRPFPGAKVWGREVSYKSRPASFALKNSKGKPYLFNIMDTPGHVDFSDEVTAALALADGAVLVIDAAEGIRVSTERAIQHATRQQIPIVLVINKVDLLIAQLKLAPEEAYLKLRHIIEQVNNNIAASSSNAEDVQVVDPALGNVCFASATRGYFFTLQSFSNLYVELHKAAFGVNEFALHLWGDFYFDHDTSSFNKKPHGNEVERSFVEFILKPLYKMHSHVPRERGESDFFFTHVGFTDMLVQHIPSAKAAAARKVNHIYTGPKDSIIYKAMEDCDSTGPLMVNVTKMYRFDGDFCAFGRVYSGEIMTGQKVRVLREDYSNDDEDVSVETVTKLWVCAEIPISKAPPGSWVLIKGVVGSIAKTATLCNLECDEDAYIFRPLQFNTLPIMKTTVKPVKDIHLPKMVEGLRDISKDYPLAITKVEAGEYTMSGTGELYLEYMERDLSQYYGLEVKVTDPVVSFRETVVGSSSMKCSAETSNKKNKIIMVAEPLELGLVEAIENNVAIIDWPRKYLCDFIQHNFGWDQLAAESIWAFGIGPGGKGPNILLADTLSSKVDKSLLNAVKDSIVQGFQWGTDTGPLCHEPTRNVKFKIVEMEISPEPLDRDIYQIIQTAYRAACSAFLMAMPRLMEPVYYVEIQTPEKFIEDICMMLIDRRGHGITSTRQQGTTTYIVKGYLPVIESIHFESELELSTNNSVICLCAFHDWAIVPGDPLAPIQSLAHDFMVNTRRRKGMSEDVNIN